MAEKKESPAGKPLISGFLMSTQLMELDGCTRCQECMKWCPTYDLSLIHISEPTRPY